MEISGYILFDDNDDDDNDNDYTHICDFNMKLSILGGGDVEYHWYDNSRNAWDWLFKSCKKKKKKPDPIYISKMIFLSTIAFHN